MKCWLSYVKISYGPVFWHTDCQIATVAMETTEQVLSQLKIFLMQWLQNWIRSLSAKIMSECCELAKLCHINRSGPVFLRQCSATSNNTKLLHWPLMGGLLHLVQRGGDWAGPQPAQAPSRRTKCNSPPINGQCTNHHIAVCSASLGGYNGHIKLMCPL